jgi:hypothetical protein
MSAKRFEQDSGTTCLMTLLLLFIGVILLASSFIFSTESTIEATVRNVHDKEVEIWVIAGVTYSERAGTRITQYVTVQHSNDETEELRDEGNRVPHLSAIGKHYRFAVRRNCQLLVFCRERDIITVESLPVP